MSFPIWPKVIYPIGSLPDGDYYAVIDKTGFSYCKNLPDLLNLPSILEDRWEDEEPDTEPDIHVEWEPEDSYPRQINGALEKAS